LLSGRAVPRFLLIAPIYAASLVMGGGQRTFHIYRALARMGTVDMLLMSEPVCAPIEADLATIRRDYAEAGEISIRHSTQQFVVPPAAGRNAVERVLYFGQRLAQAIRPRAHFYRPTRDAAEALVRSIDVKGYDVLVARYLKFAAISGALAQGRVPAVVDLDDLDEIALESKMKAPTTPLARKIVLWNHARQVRTEARRLRAKCAHVFTASEPDRALLGLAASSVLPNIPFRPAPVATPGAAAATRVPAPVILFVGTYMHAANRDGVHHFVANCWPSIRQQVSGARLRIVGSGGWETESARLGTAPAVEIVGAVRDLEHEYAGAALCIVPLLEGSGTKIKVLEALMYGRPVVASQHSTRGFEALLGHGLVGAIDDSQMIQECVAHLRNPESGRARALRGRERVAVDYSDEAVLRAVRLGVETAMRSLAPAIV
jgi:glycosyltransferase involved in cell wall biosynthesis